MEARIVKTVTDEEDDGRDYGFGTDERLAEEVAENSERIRQLDDLDFETLNSTAEAGTWEDFTLTLGSDSGGEVVEFTFQMLIFSYYSPKVQSQFAQLQERELRRNPKLQQARNRARRRGEDWTMPSAISLKLNREVLVNHVIGGWRGWPSFPYSKENAEKLLARVPHLANDIIDVSGRQANFLKLREADAVQD